MLKQRYFMYQHKALHNPVSERSSSSEPAPEDTHRQPARWSLSFYPAISHRTLSGVAERGPGASLRLRKYREDGGDFSITGCKTKTLHKDCLTSARVHGSTLRWNVCVIYFWYITQTEHIISTSGLWSRQHILCRVILFIALYRILHHEGCISGNRSTIF